MSASASRRPTAAAAIAVAVTGTVRAATAADPAAFTETTEQLAALDQSQVRIVLGDVVRMLLEEQHADGLSSDDIRDVLTRCLTSAAPWFPSVDADALVLVLTGALGMQDPEAQDIRPLPVVQHASVLIAELTAVSGRPLQLYLDAALAEIERAETIEMP
jgi:hypothetical protein